MFAKLTIIADAYTPQVDPEYQMLNDLHNVLRAQGVRSEYVHSFELKKSDSNGMFEISYNPNTKNRSIEVRIDLNHEWITFFKKYNNIKFAYLPKCSFIISNRWGLTVLPQEIDQLQIGVATSCPFDHILQCLQGKKVEKLYIQMHKSAWNNIPDNWLFKLYNVATPIHIGVTYFKADEHRFKLDTFSLKGINSDILRTTFIFSDVEKLHYEDLLNKAVIQFKNTGNKNQFIEDVIDAGYEDSL